MRRSKAVLALAALLALGFAAPADAQTSFVTELGSPYPTGANSYGVVSRDFNADGLLDLAVVNGTSSNLSVYLRQPGGGFVQEVGSPFPVGGGPNYAAAATFYPAGEALPDIAVANYAGASVSVLIRNAAGGFSDEPNGGSPIGIGGRASAVATADFNADGRPDIVAADMDNGRIRVLLRQLTGFAFRENILVGASPRQLAVADFSGDGAPDVAVANLGSDSVTILRGDPGGGPLTLEGTVAVGDQPSGLGAGDFNRDGRTDLAVVNSGSDSVQLLLRNAANGGFDASAPVTVGDVPLNVAVADFDGDGTPDAAVASNSAGTLTILRGGTAADAPIQIGRAYGVSSADFNADARPDLAVTADTSPGTVRVLLNTTQPPPLPQPPAPTPTPAPEPAPAANQLPAPVAGETINALPKSGRVRIRVPGSNRYVDLTEARPIPIGSRVDTRQGRVTLVAAGQGGSADFFDGLFRISQTRGSRPLTTLTLTEELACPRARGSATSAARKKTRRLWGDGSGRFRTRGSYTAATVRGTRWLTQDRCDSTLVRVRVGTVSVRDNVRRRTVIVRAGRSYTARRRSARTLS